MRRNLSSKELGTASIQAFRNSPSNLAIFAAISSASSLVSSWAAELAEKGRKEANAAPRTSCPFALRGERD
jgi:hypothetical protein